MRPYIITARFESGGVAGIYTLWSSTRKVAARRVREATGMIVHVGDVRAVREVLKKHG